ncbi:MAG: AAA family ATPase, partial [Cyanobacteria bacterium]|nr:AAA family ATPase [Cyanobacteriota bacterium]
MGSAVKLSSGKAGGAPKFGASTQNAFDLQKFLAKSINGGLEDVWNQATQQANGKDVTPEDLLMSLVQDFKKDLERYKEEPEKLSYFPSSYLGKLLGMTNNLHFIAEKQSQIDYLLKLESTLEADQAPHRVDEASRSHAPGERIKTYFQLSKQLLDTITTQAPEKLQTALVTEDLLLQLIGKKDRGVAGQAVRQLFEEFRVKHDIDIDEFLTGPNQATDAKEADARQPIALQDLVNKPTFYPTPGVQTDLQEALQVLKRNRSRHLFLDLPKSLNANQLVETLSQEAAKEAEKMAPAASSGSSNILETPREVPKVFRVNVLSFLEAPENNRTAISLSTEKLGAALKDLVRDHGPVLVHLQNFDMALKKAQIEVTQNFFDTLAQNGKAQFIITPSPAVAITSFNQGGERQMALPSLSIDNLPGFSSITVETPKASDIAEHVQKYKVPGLQEKYPQVTFPEATLKKAVEMALLTKELVVDTAFDFLSTAAQRFPQGPLTPEKLSRAVKEDPHLRYSTKVNLSGTYQRLGSTELDSLLENVPDIVGADKAKAFFTRLKQGIEDPNRFEKFGLKPSTRALMVGPAGTAKTALALGFAKENKLPVVYVSGKDVGHLQPAEMESVLQQAFISAKNESKRKEAKGESPFVLVLTDNLEAAARPIPNSPNQVQNPLVGSYMEELVKLKQEENPYIIALGIANSQMGIHPGFQNPEIMDETVKVEHPNLEEREAIMKSLATLSEAKYKNQFYAPNLDYNKAARRLTGVTGKTLQMVLDKAREKAMMDPTNTSQLVHNKHLDDAITTLTLGAENRKLYNILSPDDRRATAYHEGGHALTFQKMKEYLGQTALELLKVTIMPQGPALGVTFYVPESEFHTQTKTQMFAQLVSVVASLPAEQLSLNDVTTGNSNDRQVATNLAATMVTQVAMGKNKIVFPIEKPEDLSALPKEVRDEITFLI